MGKLYFKYGTMGSSKSAQALMVKFNYEQKGFKVLLLKPNFDTRDKKDDKIVVKSRIGLSSECITFSREDNLIDLIEKNRHRQTNFVIIVDECQFCSNLQIEQLQVVSRSYPVLCYGLLTNFKTELFEGSKRLVEIADSLSEIKSVCKCGKKANVNARFLNGRLTLTGDEIMIGGDESYESLCFSCYEKLKRNLVTEK